jgi:dTDP-4-dehydrorhamnose reductase
MAIQPGKAFALPGNSGGGMFGLEGAPVYGAEAREVVEGRSVLITGADDTVVLADVASRAQLAAVFRRHRPDVVFHAAACKHLPLLERHPAVAA